MPHSEECRERIAGRVQEDDPERAREAEERSGRPQRKEAHPEERSSSSSSESSSGSEDSGEESGSLGEVTRGEVNQRMIQDSLSRVYLAKPQFQLHPSKM